MKKSEIKKQLISESKDFVPDIKDEIYSSVGYVPKTKQKLSFNLKTSLALLFLFILSLFGILITGNNANSIVLVEINPAIELEVNSYNKVVAINPLNVDGYFLVENLDLKRLPINEAIEKIVDQANLDGYINEENETVNVITASRNEKREEKLNTIIETVLEKKAVQYVRNTEEVKQEAKENNVSPGRMLIIKRAIAIDQTLKLEDALKLDLIDLVKIINIKANEEIKKFEKDYKNNISELETNKQYDLQEIESYRTVYKERIKLLEDRVKQGIHNDEFEALIRSYFPDYLIDRSKLNDKKEMLQEIEKLYDDHLDYLKDVIKDKYKNQRDIYKEKIKENIKNNNDDYSFEPDIELPVGKIKKILSDEEKELVRIINQLNILFKNQFPGSNGRINKLYNEYSKLIADASEEFRNSDLVKDFEVNYENYSNIKNNKNK